MIRCCPILFAVLEEVYFNIMNMEISRKLELIFSDISGDEETPIETHDQVLMLTNELENNYEHKFLINKFYSELQTLENVGERELQLTAQTVLFINSRFFPRILTLFSKIFGIEVKYVFAINWLVTIYSITKNIIKYRSAKRHPFSNGFIVWA